MNANLGITLKKKIRHSDAKQWYAWATPAEILYIVDCWNLKASDERHVVWAREQKVKGDCTPRNFYFYMTESDKVRIRFPS